MRTILHDTPLAVAEALAKMGLTEDALLAAADQGYLARADCTANHPPLYPSFVAWGETVRALREQLAPLGWVRNNKNSYSRTVHPAGHIAIAVATGNEDTGVIEGTPLTKSSKGPSTVEAIEINRSQAWLPGMEPPEVLSNNNDDETQPTTWLLLIHHSESDIRCELSLPFEIGTDGRINGWSERIILKSRPLDPAPLKIAPPSQPDVDVVVIRKAS